MHEEKESCINTVGFCTILLTPKETSCCSSLDVSLPSYVKLPCRRGGHRHQWMKHASYLGLVLLWRNLQLCLGQIDLSDKDGTASNFNVSDALERKGCHTVT